MNFNIIGWYPNGHSTSAKAPASCVPSILCMQHRNPIGYSKAPWGLFRLVAGNRHLHQYYNLPGGLLRQCPNHYAFHAGQNLPDKNFIPYRTVIVTAAVHWGFDSILAHLLLTFQHRAGVSSYTSSFDLAQTCVFLVNSCRPILCGGIAAAPFSWKLRGQFAEFLTTLLPLALNLLPTYLCRFAVRAPQKYTQLFSPSSISDFGTNFPRSLPEPTPGSETSYVSLCLTLLVVTESLHRLCIGYAVSLTLAPD